MLKKKQVNLALVLVLAVIVMMGCENGMTGIDDYTEEKEPQETIPETIPVFERVWTYPRGITVFLTNEKTVTITRLPLTGTKNDYRGIYMVEGKYLEMTLTHSKAEAELEYQRLSQPLLLYAVYDNGSLDLLPSYENVNTGYVAPGNASIIDTVWVFSGGTTLHMGNESASITRIVLPETDARDYAGIYTITGKKYIELQLRYSKMPDDKQMERMRIGILLYAIYNETTPPTLNLYTGAILSTGFYIP